MYRGNLQGRAHKAQIPSFYVAVATSIIVRHRRSAA